MRTIQNVGDRELFFNDSDINNGLSIIRLCVLRINVFLLRTRWALEMAPSHRHTHHIRV